MEQTIDELIAQRERQVMVHSYLYYELDSPIISDWQWMIWANELADLIKQYPKEFKASPLYKAYKKFDPATGMGLYDKDREWCDYKARQLLRLHKEKNIE